MYPSGKAPIKKGNWSNLLSITFKSDQSHFLLPAEPVNSLRLPFDVRSRHQTHEDVPWRVPVMQGRVRLNSCHRIGSENILPTDKSLQFCCFSLNVTTPLSSDKDAAIVWTSRVAAASSLTPTLVLKGSLQQPLPVTVKTERTLISYSILRLAKKKKKLSVRAWQDGHARFQNWNLSNPA